MGAPQKTLSIKGKRFLLKVESSNASEDYSKYDELRNEIWDFPEDHLAGSRNMMCENFLHDGSSLFIGVYVEDSSGQIAEDRLHLVGFSYGFVGVRDKTVCFKSLDNLWFYSQYTGVLAAYRGCGLGVQIKEFQKEILVDVFGVHTVTCTYDPLTGVNASRNIHHFGMDVLEYRAAMYGEYGGFLNRLDVPTDRLFMAWDLKRAVRRLAYRLEDLLDGGHDVVEVEERRVAGRSREENLEIVKRLHPDLDHEFLLIRIPRDFYLMLRETDTDDPAIRKIPVEWRMKTREAFQRLLQRGYKIVDFVGLKDRTHKKFYVLKKAQSS
jgi:predicted GNAT superfamily acetyltransferase